MEHKLIHKGALQMIIQCPVGDNLEQLYKFAASPFNIIGNDVYRFSYLQNFMTYICKEYKILDHYYMEKILSLLRAIQQACFQFLKSHKFSKYYVKLFIEALKPTLFNNNPTSDIPVDLIFHFADIYIDELSKSTSGHLKTSQIINLLNPYISFVAYCKNQFIVNYIKKVVFIEMAEHSHREVHQFHPLVQLDHDSLVEKLEKVAMSDKISDVNREVIYSIVNKLETAKLIQGDQLDRQGEQQEGERLSTGYVDELKKKAIKATEKCSKSALVVNTSQKKAKKNKLIFSSNEKIFKDKIRIK